LIDLEAMGMKSALAVALALTFVLTSLAPLMMVSGDAQGPTVEWRLNLRALAYPGEPTAPQVVDLDGDGANELVLASAESVYVIRAKGSQKWRYSVDGIVTGVVAADLDGNGQKEVVAVTDSGMVHCLSKDGAHLWSYDAKGLIKNAPVITDFYNTGKQDIIFTAKTGLFILDNKGVLLYSDSEITSSVPLVVANDYDYLNHKASKTIYISGDPGGTIVNAKGSAHSDSAWFFPDPPTDSTAIADMDRDGQPEVIVPTKSTIFEWARWGSGVGGVNSTSPLVSPVISDLNGDGNPELVVGNQAGDIFQTSYITGMGWQAHLEGGVAGLTAVDAPEPYILAMSRDGRLSELDANGLKAWSKSLGIEANRSVIAADVDGDAEMEIIAVGTGGELILLNTHQALTAGWSMANHDSDNTRALLATEKGSLPWAMDWTHDHPAATNSTAVLADVNGDGKDEVIEVTNAGTMTLLGGDGHQMGALTLKGSTWLTPIAADVDGDGAKDIIVQNGNMVQANNRYLAQLWNHTVQDPTALAAGDVDGDGHSEVFIGNATGHIVGLHGDGGLLWDTNAGNGLSSITIADIGSDGSMDLIETNGLHYMSIRNGINGTLDWSSNVLSGELLPPMVGDLDGDGKLDVAVASQGGDIAAYSSNGTEMWKTNTPGIPLGLAAFGGDGSGQDIALTMSAHGDVLNIDGATGKTIATMSPDGPAVVPKKIVSAFLGTSEPAVAGFLGDSSTGSGFWWTNGADSTLQFLWLGNETSDLNFGDLDGDGLIEMVFSGPTSFAYRLDVGTGPTIPWAMAGHDPERTYNPYAKGGRIYPDLTIGPEDIAFDPIVANGAIRANVTITYHNHGPVPSGEFNITLSKDGTNLTTFYVPTLPAFSDGKATYKWNVNYENSTLDVALDSGNTVAELRENNNKASRMLSMNLKPVANAGPDVRTDPKKAIILDGSQSKDPDGDIVSYLWDFEDGTTAKGAVVAHAFNKSGPFNVVLTVTDEYGATGADNRTVWVNHPPTFTDWRPRANATLNEGEQSDFWVMTSDTDGDKVAVTWYLDGVSMARGNSWSWWANYSSAGTHTVLVSASDGSLFTNKTWKMQVIDSGRLIQDATPPSPVTIPEGQTQQFLVVLSGAAQDAQIEWYLDGHIVQSGTRDFSIYAGPGTQGRHDLEFRVQSDNAWDYFDWNVTIGPKADIPRIRWAFPDAASVTTVFGTPVYLGISSEGGSVQWYVNGKAQVGENDQSFRFGIWGNSSYNVSVIVSSGTNSVSRNWTVIIEHPPSANIDASALNVKIGKKVDLDGRKSKAYKASDVLTSYKWDFGDGTTDTGQAVKHAYKKAGGYQVNLTVTDSKGMTASASVTIVVQPAPQATTPGFEGIFLFLSVAITAITIARRRQA